MGVFTSTLALSLFLPPLTGVAQLSAPPKSKQSISEPLGRIPHPPGPSCYFLGALPEPDGPGASQLAPPLPYLAAACAQPRDGAHVLAIQEGRAQRGG